MPNIVHVDVPADDTERARTFHGALFGWKFQIPAGDADFFLFEPADGSGAPGVGLEKRESRDQGILVYVGVDSIAEYSKRVEELGGEIAIPFTPIPGGYGALAVCRDTENNLFGLLEPPPNSQCRSTERGA